MQSLFYSLLLGTLLWAVLLFPVFAEMTKRQIAMHVSPMPNLMMMIQANAAELELDNEQMSKVHHWRKHNMMASKMHMQNIMELEKEIKEVALEGMAKDEFQDLKDELMSERAGLMDLKYRCVTTMQATLEDWQWEKLMKIRDQQMRAMDSGSNDNEIKAFLRASPMPKLMAVILMNGDQLNMSAEQKQALENWRLKNMNHWALLFDQVLTAEKAMTKDALALVSAEKLEKEYAEVLAKRTEMAKMSLACRDNMRKVLNDEQWDKLIQLFNSYM